MKRRTRYKFQKPLKPARKKAAFRGIMQADRRASSREYFIKKKTFKTKILTAGIFILIFLGITSYILFFASIFQIKHIDIVFVNEKTLLTESEIKNIIYTILNKKYLYFFRQSNLFLFKKSELEEITRQNSRIESITLDKKWSPARLVVKITETRPVAQLVIYGDGGEYYINNLGQVIIPPSENEFIMMPLESGGDDDRNFVMLDERLNDIQDSTTINKRRDDDGYLTTTEGRRYNIPFTTLSDENKKNNIPSFKTIVMVDNNEAEIVSLPIFYDKTSQNLKNPEMITLFKNILDFITNTYLIDRKIYIPLVEISEGSGIYEVTMTTTEGWQILTNFEIDFTQQVSNLELVLKEKLQQRELLQYIDLRFGKKIFYKLK